MDTLAPPDLYDRDFYAWTQDQAARIRALGARNDGLDVENVAEEIESLGRSERTAIGSLLARLIEHLLKLRYHPDARSRGHWRKEVNAFRNRLERLSESSPSLWSRRAEIAAPEWRRAARAFLDGLEIDAGRAARDRAAASIGDPDRPYLDLDAEVLNADWFPPPAEE